MSNRFGINSAAKAGDGNTSFSADDAHDDPAAAPKPFVSLDFNQVVGKSFRETLADAEAVNKEAKAAPKPDTSNAFSMTANLVTGTASGALESVTGFFKKSKEQLARDAEFGGISALSDGHTLGAAVQKTTTDVAAAAPALNPFSETGRTNIGTLGTKWYAGMTTGTLDERANFAGKNLGFGLTLVAGGGTAAAKTTAVVQEVKAGTNLATRALTMTDNIAAATADLRIATRGVVTAEKSVVPTLTANSSHIFSPAIVSEGATLGQKTTNLFSRTTEAFGITGRRAESLTIAGAETAVSAEKGIATRIGNLFPASKPLSFNPTAIAEASQMSVAKAADDFTKALTTVETRSRNFTGAVDTLADVRQAAELVRTGTPNAERALMDAISKTGVHADDLFAQANSLLRTVEHSNVVKRFGTAVESTQTAARGLTTTLDDISRGIASTSDDAAKLHNIRRLADDVASGGAKSDELMVAVKKFAEESPNLNPQSINRLLADVTKLESASVGRRVLVGIEQSVADVGTALESVGKSGILDRTGRQFVQGSDELKALANVKSAADDLARGVGTPEKLTKAVEELRKFETIAVKSVDDIAANTAQLTEKVSVAKVFTSIDDAVKPITSATDDVEKVLATIKATNPEDAARLEHAVRDFVAGRTTNPETLRNAFSAVTREGDDAVNALIKSVDDARPMLKLEQGLANGRNSFNDAMNVLDDAARKYPAGSNPAKAIDELKEAFDAARKGNLSADDLSEVIRRNSVHVEKAIPGATEKLAVNGTKLVDAAVDTTRQIAIRNGVSDIARMSDDVVKVTDDLATRFADDAGKLRAIEDLKTAAQGVNRGTHNADDLAQALKKLDDAGVSPTVLGKDAVKQIDDLGRTADRTTRLQAIESSIQNSGQMVKRVERYADVLENAVRNSSDEFRALDNVRKATERVGKGGSVDDLVKVIKENEIALDKIGKGTTTKLLKDVSTVTDDAVRTGGQTALKKVVGKLDEAELAVKRTSSEFRAVEEIRAAVKRTNVDGVGDDLSNAIRRNENVLRNLETRHQQLIVAADKKALNLVDNLAADTRNLKVVDNLIADSTKLGDEVANARRLTAIDDSARALTKTTDNAAVQTTNISRNAAAVSEQGGKQLAQDVRTFANGLEEGAAKQRLTRLADDLESKAGTFNHVQERANIIRNLSDDVAKGAVTEKQALNFASRNLSSFDDAARNARRITTDLQDETAKLGAQTKQVVAPIAQNVDDVAKKFIKGEATIDDVSRATKELTDLKNSGKVAADDLVKIEAKAKELEAAARALEAARPAAFEGQFARFQEALQSGKLSAHKDALDAISHMYTVSNPVVREKLLALREMVLDHQAMRMVMEQGFNSNRAIAQGLFGRATAGDSLMLSVANGTLNTRPVAGIVSDKTQLLQALERLQMRADVSATKFQSPVLGLIQDSRLLSNPSLYREVLSRKLVNDIATAAAGYGLFGVASYNLYNRAQEVVREELAAPHKIAALMEAEAAALTDKDRQVLKDQLAHFVADFIRDKDPAQISELKSEVTRIVSERAAQSKNSQAVWRRKAEQNLSIAERKDREEHENQAQYGSVLGPIKGPGAPSALDVAPPVFYAAPARVISKPGGGKIDEGDKRKPATTNFDIGKIRDLSNHYNQQGLRATSFNTKEQGNTPGTLTPGATKSWQNVVSWNSGKRFSTGEPGGRSAYAQMKDIEGVPEKDGAAGGGGQTVTANDPNAVLSAQAAQIQSQANQDEQNQVPAGSANV